MLAEHSSAAGAAELGPDPKGLLRVLMVEDCDDDATLLVRELTKGGYQVVSERVETPQGMEAALDRAPWDIVVSDWVMPHFSAPDALAMLKAKDLDLPFIIVSGTIGEAAAVAAMRAGAHDYLAKDHLARLVPAVSRELREAGVRAERKKMQEQLLVSDRMASVGILAAGIAHEINNPLAAIIVNLDLAAREFSGFLDHCPEFSSLREVLDELLDARESADRIRNIVRDVKVFSRTDAERRGPVDIPGLLDSTLRMAWTEIRHRARVVKTYAPVPAVDGNESRLGQVFLNLIVNAAQSIPEGRAEANRISIGTQMANDGRVVVEIRDTGSGIPPELMKRLFTPFVTTKPVGVGTGLGLSICRRIVTSLGGQITVESDVGRGSVFRVYLLSAQPSIRTCAPSAHPRPQLARRGSVLVIDDEPTVGSAIKRALGHEHDVLTTPSAEEALRQVAAGRRYDLIICDLMMPQMTGMDLYTELHILAPEQAHRMVFLTGGAFTPRAREFLDQITNPRIEKPFEIDALRAIVNDRVGQSAG
jgi:signal transduction histidine kinase